MSFTDILTLGLISQNGDTATYIIGIFAVAVLSYLIGSVNFAVIFSRARGEDIRERGSGNAGATNIMRTYGKGVGAAVFLCDFFKGALCVFIGMLIMPADGYAYVAALFCMIGHVYPIYFGFRGGKGVAVMSAAMILLNPPAGALSVVVFALFLLFSKYVSLSSIAMSLVFPVFNFYIRFSLFSTPSEPDVRSLVNYILRMTTPILMAVFVAITHVSNIRRIINGTERRIGEEKNEKN